MIGRIIIPVIIIFLSFFIPTFLINEKLFSLILPKLMLNDENLSIVNEVVSQLDLNIRYIAGVIAIYFTLNYFRTVNKEKIFNANGNIYYNYYYVIWWIAATFLGYTKIQLAGIPLSMQYKLILNGLFPSVVPDLWDSHYDENKSRNSPEIIGMENLNKELKSVNLFIQDTYMIPDNEVLEDDRNRVSIKVTSSSCGKGSRSIDLELINGVKRAFAAILKEEIDEIYIFSTANPINNLNLINSVFRLFGRNPQIRIFVKQRDTKTKKYPKKNYRVV